MLVAGWMVLTTASIEPASRNIVYVHVPSAVCSLVCFVVLFVCSIQYLRSAGEKWDCVAVSAAEVGLLFATIMNVTGMIFAKAEWGTFWTPSPRLVSSAAMWFLYAAYLVLRTGLGGGSRMKKISAVFGIIAFADVPLVVISARFIRDIHRPSFSFESGRQVLALGLAVCGAVLLGVSLVWFRSDTLRKTKKSFESAFGG